MSQLVNGRDSIITSAPDFHNNKLRSNLPKPFEKFTHLQNVTNSLSNTPKSPALVSPHNRAWFDSPDGFIGRIPESNILSKCTAFVDVWSSDGLDNRSLVFSRILNRMGATIAKKFTKLEKITHLVFKDGHKSYLQKAKKREVKVVNCLWVERCKVNQAWVDETPYIFNDSNYVPPKRFREMQPLSPEEEQIRSAERAKRRQKREEKRAYKKGVAFLSPLVTNNEKFDRHRPPLACDTPFNQSTLNYLNPLLVSETPSESILRKLQRMKEGKPIFSPPSSPISDCSQPSSLYKEDASHKNPDLGQTHNEDVIPSSQFSDMELTCHNSDQVIDVNAPPHIHVEDTSDTCNGKSTLSDSGENSDIRLHVSESSTTFDGSPSLHVDDDMEKQPPSSPPHKVVRSRRKLCDDEVYKPASVLMSPAISLHTKQPFERRRSKRLSSALASQAILSMCERNNKKKFLPPNSPASADTTFSILPPPGSKLKITSSKSRYFDPIESPSLDQDLNNLTGPNLVASENLSVSSSKDNLSERSSSTSNVSKKRTSTRRKTSSQGGRKNSSRSSDICLTPKKRKKKTKTVALDKRSVLEELMTLAPPRRSAEEFNSPQGSYRLKKKSARKGVLVFTSLHSHERKAMKKIVRQLGRFEVQLSVKVPCASHVVCGDARRTLNVLHAITRGLWLLSKDWLFDSMKAGHWLDEEDYEVDYFPSAKQTRLLRHKTSRLCCSVFKPVQGYVYVSPETNPPADDIEELITRSGGHVIHSPRRALIRVGQSVLLEHSLPTVRETWVLDSIVDNSLKSVDNYRII